MSRKKRVVLINQYFDPSDAATAVLLRELVEDLSPFFDVTVVCESSCGSASKSLSYQVVRLSLPVWIPEQAAVRSRLLRWVSSFLFIIRALAYLLFSKRPDLVCFASEPPFIDMVGGLICVARRQRFVIVVQDLYPEFAQGVGLQPVALLAWPLKKLQSFVGCRARKVIAISRDHEGALAKRGVVASQVIPNWAPASVVLGDPLPMPQGDGRMILHYAGNLGLACDLDALGVALAALEAQGTLSHFAILLRGDGIKRDQAEELARRYSQVSYQHRVPESEMAAAMAECHAHLVLMPAKLEGCVYPSKTYSIMAAGRPMLASIPINSSLASCIQARRVGYVSPAEDPSQLAPCMMRCFRDFIEDPSALSEMGARGWQFVHHEWNRAKATSSYRALFEEALHDR
jgi:colanic acid biosynthesis glycosyl transferase WcaI